MTDYHKMTRKQLVDELKAAQKQAATLAVKNGGELMLRENNQLRRDLIRERQRTAQMKTFINVEIMNDISSPNVPIPYVTTGKEKVLYDKC